MKKKEIKRRMQDGFSELSPDIFEAVMARAEKENLMPLKIEYEEECADIQKINDMEKARKAPGPWDAFWGNFPKYAMSFCTCLLVLLICVSGISGTKQEDVYLVMDINPSVQIVMDEDCQVKRLNGLNQDGKEFIKQINWKKKQSVFDVLDLLLQDAAAKSYLQENSGILVTICLQDQTLYKDLEGRLGERIDQRLEEIGVSGVLTAFVQGEKGTKNQGRKQLETELAETYGIEETLVQQMSVTELIRCCQEHAFAGLTFSAESDKAWKDFVRQEQENKKDSQEKTEPVQEKAEPEQKTEPRQEEAEPEQEKTEPEQETVPKPDEPADREPDTDQRLQKEQDMEQKAQEEKENPGQEEKPYQEDGTGTQTAVQPQENTDSSVLPEIPASAEPAEHSPKIEDVLTEGQEEGAGAFRRKDKKDKENNGNKDKDKENNGNKDKDKENNGSKDKDKENNGSKDKDKENNGSKNKEENSNKNNSQNNNGNKGNSAGKGNSSNREENNSSNREVNSSSNREVNSSSNREENNSSNREGNNSSSREQ